MHPPASASDPDREEWHEKHPDYLHEAEPPSANENSVSLEDTLTVVKEKVWSLGDAALKGVAEVLVGFGISPTILGYTEEELFEDEDGEESQPKIRKDEVVSKTSFLRRSEESMNRRRSEDPTVLAAPVAGEEEEAVERSPSVGRRSAPELTEGDFPEDKKDK